MAVSGAWLATRRVVSGPGVALTLLAATHGAFAWTSRELRADFTAISPPPTLAARDALAFGDHQFVYRIWAFQLQNAGDSGGRVTRMGDYNYDYVIGWLDALRELDPRAQHHVFLAARYFSQTPNPSDIRRVIGFIVRDAEAQPNLKWYWLTQATTIAETRLRDLPLALEISQKAARFDFPDVPNWVRVFPAVLLEKMGRYPDARAVIADVQLRKGGTLRLDERLWIEDFLQRLP